MMPLRWSPRTTTSSAAVLTLTPASPSSSPAPASSEAAPGARAWRGRGRLARASAAGRARGVGWCTAAAVRASGPCAPGARGRAAATGCRMAATLGAVRAGARGRLARSFDPRRAGDSLPIAKKSYERVSAREREAVLSALDALGSRVTLGDVARKSGLDLAVVEDVMRDVAADADGFSLEVSDAGDLVYVKPRGMVSVRAALLSKSALLRMEPLAQRAAGIASYLVRVSFGSALVLSVVIVYTSIFVLLTSQQRSDNDNRRGSYGRSPMMMRGFYLNPFDVFWYWDPFYYRNYRARIRRNGKYNFLEAVFSFVFGDGDPNEGYDAERWEAIGRLISNCNGVVTAEQLAPYTDSAPLLVGGADVGIANDEGFVLPVLQRFGGVPEVDPNGNIFYRFPDLQKTAAQSPGGQRRYRNQLPGFNLEKKWAFSEAEAGQLVGAAALGAANFFGVFYLSGILRAENLVRALRGPRRRSIRWKTHDGCLTDPRLDRVRADEHGAILRGDRDARGGPPPFPQGVRGVLLRHSARPLALDQEQECED